MVFNIIGWSFVAAATAWGLTLSWAKHAMTRSKAAMDDQVRYWAAEAVKARDVAAQLKHEMAILSKGRQQGREDVIAIMPLLIAAQERLAGPRLAETTDVSSG